MLSGSRTINHCRYPLHFQTGLSYCTQNVVVICNYSTMFCNLKQALHRSSPFIASVPNFSSFPAKRFNFCSDTSSSSSDVDVSFVSGVQPSQRSQVSDSLSEHEEAQEAPSERLSALAGGIVALGKFDALHIGHRELAIQASKIGVPFLLSFAGMAEVLGWEPRAPIVATCDRQRVLFSWAPYCGNLTPKEFQIEFSKVRSLNPRQFVEKLSLELGVHGVVAGENYRFGYRASGTASDLVRLCEEYGMRAHIITSVMDKNQDCSKTITANDPKERGQVSSTRVRQALAQGDMKYVAQLLGRPHRLMLSITTTTTRTEQEEERLIIDNGGKLSAPKSCVLNLPPAEGLYEKCSLIVGDNKIIGPCRTVIDSTRIHLELDKLATTTSDFSFQQDLELLGIEFGEELRQVV